MRIAVLVGLALLGLVAAPVSASAYLQEAKIEVGATSARVRLDWVVAGTDADHVRAAMDTDDNDYVSAAEVAAYEAGRNATRTADGPSCLSDFQMVRLDGKTPRRLDWDGRKFFRAEGPTSGGTELTERVQQQYTFPTVSESPTARVQFDALGDAERQSHCGSQPNTLYTQICIKSCGEFPEPVFYLYALGPRKLDQNTLQPAEARPLWDGAGLRAVTAEQRTVLEEHPIEVRVIVPRSSPSVNLGEESTTSPPWGQILLGGLALAGVASILSIESVRFGLLSRAPWLLPLFSRFEKDEVLEHHSRDELITLIKTNPGQSLADLRRVTGLPHGTTIHHLRILEAKGYIRAVRDGFRTRFYMAGPRIEPEPYLTEVQTQVLDAIRSHPGLTQKELASAMSLPRESVAYHVRRLQAQGRVDVQSHGRWRRYFAKVAPPVGASEMATG